MKIDWKRKLASRKFWALLAALSVALVSAFGADSGTLEHIASIISAVGACAVYMLAEAHTDAAMAQCEIIAELEIEEAKKNIAE